MKTSKFGEIVLAENDLCDLVMQGRDLTQMDHVVVDSDLDLQQVILHVQDPGSLLTWRLPEQRDISVLEFDREHQAQWFMPTEYRDLDIAQHILDLCTTQEQLQRVGEELLLYQEHDLFDLLRYLRYLVAVMRENGIIWGVGRGSSVASYVLYLLGVHRIDSMFYDLDPREFLR
jgi:DNA polymerase III alpha subunit